MGLGEMSEGHRWLIGIVVAVASLIIAVLAWQYPKSAASPRPASIASSGTPAKTATPVPTVGRLLYTQLQVGDCITGNVPFLFSNEKWPSSIFTAVSCSQGHTGEVIFADNTYWDRSSSYPGDSATLKGIETGCDDAFKSYVGVPHQNSKFFWSDIGMNGAASWRDGDRALYCIAYEFTENHPEGVTTYGSIKGSRR